MKDWNNLIIFKKETYNGENINHELFDDWAKDKPDLLWSQPKDLYCVNRIISKNDKFYKQPPYVDHLQLFKSKSLNKFYYVYHPYYPFDFLKEKIDEWNIDNKYNIKFFAPPNSWYNEKACMIIIECDLK